MVTWGRAYRASFGMYLSIIFWWIVGIAIIAIGTWAGGENDELAVTAASWLVGLTVIALTVTAAFFKKLGEIMSEVVEYHLNARPGGTRPPDVEIVRETAPKVPGGPLQVEILDDAEAAKLGASVTLRAGSPGVFLRSELQKQLYDHIVQHEFKLDFAQAASQMGVSQTKVNELLASLLEKGAVEIDEDA